MAHVLKELGSKHVLIVHADDGLDEISIGSKSSVAELKDGIITTYTIEPENFGLTRCDISQLAVSNAQESLAIIKDIFAGKLGGARDIVVLNAGAAIYAADLSDSLAEGIKQAQITIDSGKAQEKLDALIACSNS